MKEEHWTYELEYVRCGKRGCKSCPHGPYWYAYRKVDGRLHKKYIGKKRGEEGQRSATWADPWDTIFSRRTATTAVAIKILGLPDGFTKEELSQRYKKLAMENHPDRGGDVKRLQQINAAFSFLKCQRQMW